ncbi:MAG TPA: alpha/beta hydrolase [Polyangiales bacterium]|jgi:pimeloyl-ACP methyl ester carboxylesterase|nr:alpha/beta hydrolase [Polyangiales bacterium]
MEYDQRGFAVANDGTKLFYGIKGAGVQSLVLLDGIGCDGWAWTHIQPHLALHRRVLHTHYRGHGRSGSGVDPEATDIATLRDDVVSVLDATNTQRVVLMAHSMGTQVALEIYRKHPERVQALILVCGSYGKITHTFHGNDILHRVLPTLIANVRRYESIARALWGRLPPALSYRVARWLREIDGATLRPEDFKLYVEHLSDIELDLYLTMLQKAGDHSAEDLLPQIRVPTLVIAAERDTFTPAETVKLMADQIPGVTYRELIGASHAAPSEQPDIINEAIDEFLAKLT